MSLDGAAARSAAMMAALERAMTRSDVTHEIVAPWVLAAVVVIEGAHEIPDAQFDGVIDGEGAKWLTQWFAEDPRHGGPIRCFTSSAPVPDVLAEHIGSMTVPALFALSHKDGGRARISLYPPEPEPVPLAPSDEREIRIDLSGPHEVRETGSWCFLAACAPWKDRADLTGIGDTPGAALADLGQNLDRHLAAGGWSASVANTETKKPEASNG